ncbi:DUF4262 domain-containing protein [Chitinophaga tropicalis]|uniref:DUF4262 domain-containing protein n=1 Tax=Chitinophaga tropicalis TaxID=2683588 RepID=A0A7K1U054_9BACT|nr:DUF4262 domain-containing protein [Chitinophaga tropicalis]MVT07680.1 DUF4262 domain-containing protein [Chitinophaga tropicalis]
MHSEENQNRIAAWQQQMLDRFGWYIHFVRGGDEYPCQTNYHTHGLPEKFGHPDLQICLNIPVDKAKSMFHTLVDEINAGNKFCADQTYLGLLHGEYPVRFAGAQEGGRKLLRVLVPDQHGQLIESPYNQQLTLLKDGYPLPALDYTPNDIEDIGDVINFIVALKTKYELPFHPDTIMEDYRVQGSEASVFTPVEAAQLNTVRARCFEICGQDYDFYVLSEQLIALIEQQKQQQEQKTDNRPKARRTRKR